VKESSSKRRYHSPRRQAQAAATRQKLLETAERLFASQGYGATTLAAIAHDAGVSLPTVTAVFGTKLAILNALIDTTVRGNEMPISLSERNWWTAALNERDPVRLLQRYAANIRRIHERTTDIFEIVRGAATVDPELAALRRDLATGRLRDSHLVASVLATNGVLKPDVTVDRAADLLWALVSAELYRMLAVDRGWTPDDYEQWLTSTLIDALLSRVETA
jgi:AcrR family transcriptional regulator